MAERVSYTGGGGGCSGISLLKVQFIALIVQVIRGAERVKFQLRCTSQCGVMSAQRNLIETMDYSPWFSAKNGEFGIWKNVISLERASQEEQNGTNFSFVTPSSEEV